MDAPFFPDSGFGWTFYALLVLLTALASYTDLRWFVVPKWISVTALAAGLLANVVRGALLGYNGLPVWTLEESGVLAGALDGLLFSLAGFAVGFGLFFTMWVLRICGGGDVKLFAAVSAWVGPRHALWLLAGCTVIMVLFAVVRVVGTVLTEGFKNANRSLRNKPGAAAGKAKPLSRLSTYALPLAITTAVLMLWFYRYDLNLAARSASGAPSALEGMPHHAN